MLAVIHLLAHKVGLKPHSFYFIKTRVTAGGFRDIFVAAFGIYRVITLQTVRLVYRLLVNKTMCVF